MLQAFLRTTTEILDSKKAAYSFIAVGIAVMLHVKFGVTPENALLLVSPLGLATAAQAHVDAKRAATESTNGVSSVTAAPATQDTAPSGNNSPQG